MTHKADDRGSDLPSLNELISLQEAAEVSGLSAGHLRLLVSRGDLWGMKLGRNWVTYCPSSPGIPGPLRPSDWITL